MKWLKLLSLSGVAVVSLVAVVAGPANAAGELHLYNWGDYINPEVIDKFGKEFDVKVSLDTYSTNEEFLPGFKVASDCLLVIEDPNRAPCIRQTIVGLWVLL